MTSRDSGIDSAVTSVDRTEVRNSRITTTANARPSRPSVVRSSTDCSMNGAWSKTTVNCASCPSACSSWGNRSSTPWDTSTVLPSGVLVMATARLARPSVRAIDVVGASARSTVATSPRVTGAVVAAPAPGSSGRARSCARSAIGVPTVTDSVRSASSTVPAGTTTPLACSAALSDAGVRRAAARRAGSRRTCTCSVAAPLTVTSRTPSTSSNAGTAADARRSASTCGPASEVTASWMTGKASRLPAMTLVSVPVGSCAVAPAREDCSCCCASSRSVP